MPLPSCLPALFGAGASCAAGPDRLVEPVPPGIATDVVARSRQEALAHALGQPLVIDTRAAVAQRHGKAGRGQRIASRRHVPRCVTPAERTAFLPQQLAVSNRRVRLAGIEPQ